MKKFALCLILASLLVVPVAVLGADVTPPSGDYTLPENADPFLVLETISDWLFAILLTVAAICFILAGFNFITSSGDPEKVGSARQYVLYALIGVLVAFLAKGLIALVNNLVTK